MLGSHNHGSDPKISLVSKQILHSTVPPKKNLESPTSADLTTQTVTSSHDSKFLPTVLQGTISVDFLVCSEPTLYALSILIILFLDICIQFHCFE